MLMMVDPHVHFHVIPRYNGTLEWNGFTFPDSGWPGPPDLKSAIALSPQQVSQLRDGIAVAHLRRKSESVVGATGIEPVTPPV